MPDRLQAFVRGSKKLGILGFGSLAVAVTFIGLSSGTASAEIIEVEPEPVVTSRQATLIDEDAVRPEGTTGEIRVAPESEVRGGVAVKDTTKAVPGSKVKPFTGRFPPSPQIGDF